MNEKKLSRDEGWWAGEVVGSWPDTLSEIAVLYPSFRLAADESGGREIQVADTPDVEFHRCLRWFGTDDKGHDRTIRARISLTYSRKSKQLRGSIGARVSRNRSVSWEVLLAPAALLPEIWLSTARNLCRGRLPARMVEQLLLLPLRHSVAQCAPRLFFLASPSCLKEAQCGLESAIRRGLDAAGSGLLLDLVKIVYSYAIPNLTTDTVVQFADGKSVTFGLPWGTRSQLQDTAKMPYFDDGVTWDLSYLQWEKMLAGKAPPLGGALRGTVTLPSFGLTSTPEEDAKEDAAFQDLLKTGIKRGLYLEQGWCEYYYQTAAIPT